MNEERKCLLQVEHIRGHLWHRRNIQYVSILYEYIKWGRLRLMLFSSG